MFILQGMKIMNFFIHVVAVGTGMVPFLETIFERSSFVESVSDVQMSRQ